MTERILATDADKALARSTEFDGYYVTPDGHVWSARRWNEVSWLRMTPQRNKRGYRTVVFKTSEGPRGRAVGAVIAKAFHGEAPSPEHWVHRLNGDRADDRAENLKWASYSEISLDRKRPLPPHGTHRRYATYKCHCEICRDAAKKRGIESRRRQKERCVSVPPAEQITAMRKHHLKRSYDLTPEEYWSLFLSEDGACWICQRTQKKWLAVDHDHKTGKIRGLLCSQCNSVLGWVEAVGLENIQKWISDEHNTRVLDILGITKTAA